MKGDDDDDEDSGAIGVARYPCLPSLVALQQMRNRLHLAHVGRKLMKWTAMATGRELRRIAAGLIEVYQNYDEEVRSAYIQLARCRYFYPNLNLLVSGNPPRYPKEASITVNTTQKSVTGCRVLQFDIVDSNIDPYAHLAMDKGGQACTEAKKMWQDLLKKMVLMLQLRTSFMLAEFSHKSANKKSNVLSKIIIPRTQMTINYILLELEELAREELFRIKLVTKWKARQKKSREKTGHECPICNKTTEGQQHAAHEIEQAEPELKISLESPIKSELISQTPEFGISIKTAKFSTDRKSSFLIPDLTQPSEEVKKPLTMAKYVETDEKKLRLILLDQHIDEIMKRTEEYLCQGLLATNVQEFLKSCEEVKTKIANYMATANVDNTGGAKEKEIKLNSLEKDVDHLKTLTTQIKKEGIAKDTLEPFLLSCEKFKGMIGETKEEQPRPKASEGKVTILESKIDEALELSSEAKDKGLKTNSFEEFINLCEDMKSKLDARKSKIISNPVTPKVMMDLGSNIDDVMDLVESLRKEGVLTASVERLLKSGAMTKGDIDRFDGTDTLKTCSTNCTCESDSIASTSRVENRDIPWAEEKTVSDEEEVKHEMGDEKKQPSEVIEKRVSQDKDKCLCSKEKHSSADTGNISSDDNDTSYYSSEDERMSQNKSRSFSQDKAKSLSAFKDKRHSSTRQKHLSGDNNISKTKRLGSEKRHSQLEKYSTLNEEQKVPEVTPDELPPPCAYCKMTDRQKQNHDAILKQKLLQEEELPYPCRTCEGEDEEPEPEGLKCEICENEETVEEEENETAAEIPKIRQDIANIEDNLGYFENKIRRIVRLKRTKADDGTVREERTTITIRKQKHDPTESALVDDDDKDCNMSKESLIKKGNHKINVCIDKDEGGRGFKKGLMKVSSEQATTSKPKAEAKKSASDTKVCSCSNSGSETELRSAFLKQSDDSFFDKA